MPATAPVVYVFNGDDEFAIAQHVSDLENKLGDDALAAMNVTRLDGRSFNPDDLPSVAGAAPFLSKRRIVILTNPLARLASPAARDKFKSQLEQLPTTTALVLVEPRLLTEDKDRKNNKIHWLEQWAVDHPEWALLKTDRLPHGAGMAQWIQKQARAQGGQITPQAAGVLASLTGDDPRLADQEIGKLLAYVNFQRPVEPDDVELLTTNSAQADIFAMVDALSLRDGRRAAGLLHRVLEQQEAMSVFGMVVRQFRLLLLARDALDRGVPPRGMAAELKVHPYVAEKITGQASRFSLADLEEVYHRLLEVDQAAKTGQVPLELALETFVAAFTMKD